eukprot:6212495-Pleurochrysis_carterae.AAC.2
MGLRSLTVAVFVDLLAVSLVVPLLPRRYKQLGVSPALAGLIGSVYSAAQIVGGLAFGMLADRVLGRRTVLLVSVAGTMRKICTCLTPLEHMITVLLNGCANVGMRTASCLVDQLVLLHAE